VIPAGQPTVMPVQRKLGDPQPAAGRQVHPQRLVVDPDLPAGLLRTRQALLPATGRLARVMRQAEEITGITRPESRGEPAGQFSRAMQMIGQRVPHSGSVQAVSPHRPPLPFRPPHHPPRNPWRQPSSWRVVNQEALTFCRLATTKGGATRRRGCCVPASDRSDLICLTLRAGDDPIGDVGGPSMF